jgi:hypothetical protein
LIGVDGNSILPIESKYQYRTRFPVSQSVAPRRDDLLLLEFLLPACHTFSTGELPESFVSEACFVAPLQVAVSSKERRAALLDSLDWSKKYEVLSISRLYLSSLGFTDDQIKRLSDDDMQRIAEKLENDYRDHGFDEDVKFLVSLELAEKEQ